MPNPAALTTQCMVTMKSLLGSPMLGLKSASISRQMLHVSTMRLSEVMLIILTTTCFFQHTCCQGWNKTRACNIQSSACSVETTLGKQFDRNGSRACQFTQEMHNTINVCCYMLDCIALFVTIHADGTQRTIQNLRRFQELSTKNDFQISWR